MGSVGNIKFAASQLSFRKIQQMRKKSTQYFLKNPLTFSGSTNLNCDINSGNLNCKNDLYYIAEGIKVRSKCQWYKEGKKTNTFFLNLEKTKATKDTVKKTEIKDTDISAEINKELVRFFENWFKKELRKTKHAYNEFLRDISLSTLSQEKKKVCD